ncbi:hypothetical protein DOTSEDRAFT_176288 [Dothistroma septosporum NZE10]|uniref:Uncharacterized protein n=1 Tax=Dothistroma septosporum (strain NZE10 / CBS 128990) TaxID=675120 RepID=N1PFX5_DOTSN|nr:hypothetical protein DOTSEDRAFT_176288 [Dothistroma septosporum NZE10]
MRHLELRVRAPYVPPPKAGAKKDPSIALIDVDLDVPEPEMAMVNLGYYIDRPHVIHSLVRKAIAKISRMEKQPLVTREVLWDIWEACYFLSRADTRESRTWADFVRACELNRSKVNPQRWSEDVYHETSQEAIYGANWRLLDVPSANTCKRGWDCTRTSYRLIW